MPTSALSTDLVEGDLQVAVGSKPRMTDNGEGGEDRLQPSARGARPGAAPPWAGGS
jgi:hypothetical protein